MADEILNEIDVTSLNIIENKDTKEVLIDSLKYLPDFLQDKPLMQDAATLLDALISEEDDLLAEIHQAYCDTLYKISAYQQLSYAAKKELLKEKGFEYLLNLLKHIYEERYTQLTKEEQKRITLEEYLEKETSKSLANITTLFNLLYILKGKTLGLELALKLVNAPEFIYITWDTVANYKGVWNGDFESLPLPTEDTSVRKGDCYTLPTTDVIFNGVSWHKCTSYKAYETPRRNFTAELTIWGMASPELQAQIAEFVRYYMLPAIDVKLEFSGAFESVYAFPSGDCSLLRSHNLYNYVDNYGRHLFNNLSHDVSQDCWKYSLPQELDIKMGKPIYRLNGFQGEVDLKNSYVLRNGIKHYLYGDSKTIPDFITGTALHKVTDEGTVDFDNDYIQAPLQRDYVSVDITTGDQINPYYIEDELIRDTIIQYNTALLVEGIHHAKTVSEMNELYIDDFLHDITEAEVWAGRVTNALVTNPSGRIHFTTTPTETRDKTGLAETTHLKFSDALVDKYTGIGDLGILGANTYFIYNGMLYKNNNIRLDSDDDWTDIGASHAVSDLYYTPAIKGGHLKYIKGDVITHLADGNWTHVTGYVNEFYSAFAINNGKLYRIYLDGEIKIELMDNGKWDYITGCLYSQTYEAYGIKNNVMYRIGAELIPLSYNGEILAGWDYSFDCISRYHHSNEQYITYGICKGNLYYIQDETVGLLSNSGKWTAVCGYYNDKSPRTFGYAIEDGKLYELQGTAVVLKDDTNVWTKITGCTTATNNYVMGIGSGYLYKINAKTLEKLKEDNGYTDIFGRYTTSTAKANNCYGYAVNKKLHVFNKQDEYILTGCWKVDGKIVDIHDYNIADIIVQLPDGQIVEGVDNVINVIPQADEPLSDYDIYVTYETLGFDDNARYQIKTYMSDVEYTYINPELCRDDVVLNADFDTRTGYISNFTNCPVILHGGQQVDGEGKASGFIDGAYIELPTYYNVIEGEFETEYIEKPITEAVFKITVIPTTELYPAILDKDGNTGIYYGYNEDLQRSGIFLKADVNGATAWIRLLAVNEGQEQDLFIKYVKATEYSVFTSIDGVEYSEIANPTQTVYSPKYLGGYENNVGDAVIDLSQSYIETDEHIDLYEHGKYFGVNTLQQDLVEHFITPESQKSQKVIEIQNESGDKIIELSMNQMYESRKAECSTDALTITDNHCVNTLNYGDTEGTTKSTLVFSGSYEIDPTKGHSVGNLKTTSNYGITSVVTNFNQDDYIEIDPVNPLVITSGNNVENQILFQTEEDNAYTNKYLLTADIDSIGSLENHVVPAGVIFELNTDEPGIVKRTLEYNAPLFQVDTDKIQNSTFFNFDEYTAILSGFSQFEDMAATIPLQLTQTSSTEYDVMPILKIKTSDTYKQKIAELGEEDVIIGNLEYHYYKDGVEITKEQYEEETQYNGDIEEEHEYEVRTETDETAYPWEQSTDYFVKMNMTKVVTGLQNIELHETTSTEPKDRFINDNGVLSNFSHENYIKTVNLKSKYGLTLSVTLDDDASKDQGIIGVPNGQSICIKDKCLCLCDENGNIIEQGAELYDEQTIILHFVTDSEDPQLLDVAHVYFAYEDRKDLWEQLFEGTIKIEDEMWIGFASAGSGMLPFNGSMDLTKSYMDQESKISEKEAERLYAFTQTNNFYVSEDGVDYTLFQTIELPYEATDLMFGYEFNGQLDMYGSDLILPYELGWLENRKRIDQVIKEELEQKDPTYDPELDENVYGIEEYGIHLDAEPNRWDTITVTYTTKDHAYYMEPNTKYYLNCTVELDENGECIPEKVGEPSWNSGVVSNFSEDNYYTLQFTNEKVLILNCTPHSLEDQTLCGYPDGQAICIKDGFWQYFDDTNYHVICEATLNPIAFELSMNTDYIKYYNGEWITTDIEAGFSGYDIFMLGKANGQVFNGSINLNTSCLITDSINYLFRLYKKVTPYISKDQEEWYPIVLDPLLTLNDTIKFGQGFNGKLHLVESDLVDPDCVYWTANQVNVYAMVDMPEDDIKADDLIRTEIRDELLIDPSKVYTDDEIVKVDLDELKLVVEGLPEVGDVITLTYDVWYLFRQFNSHYDFKITYGDWAVVSYSDGVNEYVLYKMPVENHIVNTGYNYWGVLSVKDSTRGGMMLCNYLEYRKYEIIYKKPEDTDWLKWTEFYVESRYTVYKRTGFELNGLLYMDTSYVKMGDLVTPFIAHWDGTYITVVGEVKITEDGMASHFTEDAYLQLVMANLQEGDKVCFDVIFGNMRNQGIGSCFDLRNSWVCRRGDIEEEDILRLEEIHNVKTIDEMNAIEVEIFDLNRGDIDYTTNELLKVRTGYKACIEYSIEDGQVKARIIGRNTADFKLKKSKAHTLTIIPYNENRSETDIGHYVTTETDANKLKVYYRLGGKAYDLYTDTTAWYPVELQKVDSLKYFSDILEGIYVAKINMGYIDNVNTNPDNIEYLDNETVEYKIVSEKGSTLNSTVLYTNKIEKQRSLL